MSVILATPAYLPAIRTLLRTSPRRQLHLGDEDWSGLLAAGSVRVGEDNAGLWGVLALVAEPRPPSLPPGVPARDYLRAVGFRHGVSPSAGLTELLQAYVASPGRAPQLLIAYGGESWLERAYEAAGLTVSEQVVYFERDRLNWLAAQLQPPAGPAQLRPATPGDLDALADLDAATFDVLWHLSAKELRTLLFQGSIQMAIQGGVLAGYMVCTVQGESAQLARLAVHPAWQGRGIGRQLLTDCLLTAAAQGCRRAVLNTQASNQAAQHLYRSFGFTATGQRLAVYTALLL